MTLKNKLIKLREKKIKELKGIRSKSKTKSREKNINEKEEKMKDLVFNENFVGDKEHINWIEFDRKSVFLLLFLLLLLGSLTLGLVNATTTSTIQTLGTFRMDDCITLIQTCDNCSYVNITKILYPNTSIAGTNIGMSKSGTIFNSTFCDTHTTGWYIINTVGDLDGSPVASSYNLQVTKSGEDFSVAKSIMYIFMLILSYFLFITCIISFVKIDWKDPKDYEGRIVSVNDFKFMKVIMFFVSYLMLIFAFFVTYGVLNSFLYYDALTNIFKLLYTVGLYLLYPMFIVGFGLLIYMAIESKKLKKLLDRGLQP